MKTELKDILSSLDPILGETVWRFCVFESLASLSETGLEPLMVLREAEGLTALLPASVDLPPTCRPSAPMRQITLRVHSDLEAVGLTAAVSRALAVAGLSANVVAGYYHDHIFVPDAGADAALSILIALQSSALGEHVHDA